MGSVAAHVLLSDMLGLKNPGAHGLHFGCLVVVPGSLVNLPAGHFVWAVQEYVVLLLFEVRFVKYPGGHVSHRMSVAVGRSVLVYLPGGGGGVAQYAL